MVEPERRNEMFKFKIRFRYLFILAPMTKKALRRSLQRFIWEVQMIVAFFLPYARPLAWWVRGEEREREKGRMSSLSISLFALIYDSYSRK
jgi:hypothetical protein